MDIQEWAKKVGEIISDHGSRIKKLEEKNNATDIVSYFTNRRIIEQLIRSWDAYIDNKTVGDLPLQEYQRKDIDMFDFIAWLKKDLNDRKGNTETPKEIKKDSGEWLRRTLLE